MDARRCGPARRCAGARRRAADDRSRIRHPADSLRRGLQNGRKNLNFGLKTMSGAVLMRFWVSDGSMGRNFVIFVLLDAWKGRNSLKMTRDRPGNVYKGK